MCFPCCAESPEDSYYRGLRYIQEGDEKRGRWNCNARADKDYVKAFKILKKLADKGDVRARGKLGDLCVNGHMSFDVKYELKGRFSSLEDLGRHYLALAAQNTNPQNQAYREKAAATLQENAQWQAHVGAVMRKERDDRDAHNEEQARLAPALKMAARIKDGTFGPIFTIGSYPVSHHQDGRIAFISYKPVAYNAEGRMTHASIEERINDVMHVRSGPVEYDEQGRIVFMWHESVRYNPEGRIAFIGSKAVVYHRE